jgi:hypothetical protein
VISPSPKSIRDVHLWGPTTTTTTTTIFVQFCDLVYIILAVGMSKIHAYIQIYANPSFKGLTIPGQISLHIWKPCTISQTKIKIVKPNSGLGYIYVLSPEMPLSKY